MSKSIMQRNNDRCFLTGYTCNLEKHHVMNGSGVRAKAEHDGLWVMLTHHVHRWIHDTGDGAEFARHLKAQAQYEYEQRYGHEAWMKRYKRDYIRGGYYDKDIGAVYRSWNQ